MPNPNARGADLFREIVTCLRRQPDPTRALTLRQIANLALGKGDENNAGLVGRTISAYSKYFRSMGAYKVAVNWRLIEEEHPQLLPQRAATPARTTSSPIAEMLVALEDEHREVLHQVREHPITAHAAQEVARFTGNSFLYEATVAIGPDSELSIPEGVGLKAVWNSPFLQLRGTLLAFDPLQSRIIFEVDQEVPSVSRQQAFRVYPAIDELILAVRDRLRSVNWTAEALASRLLSGRVTQMRSGIPPSAEDLDESQLRTVWHCLQHDVTFLWGPPGTGKTHTLARLISHLVRDGKRVLAVAIANVAVDQLATKLVQALSRESSGRALLESGKILRFGYARLPEVMSEKQLFPNQQEIQTLRQRLHDAQHDYRSIPERHTEKRALQQKLINELKQALRDVTKRCVEDARVVLTTSVQTCLETALLSKPFDVVVIDEGSMMPPPFALCAASLGHSSVVLAGDYRQLGPIAISKSELAMRWLHRDCFKVVGIEGNEPRHPGLTMLTTQRRMHVDIREMINAPFYGRKLQGEASPERLTAAQLPPQPGAAAVLVRTTRVDGSETLQTEGHSRTNPCNAQLSALLAKSLAERSPSLHVGVIAPYRGQVSVIRRLIREFELSRKTHDRIRVGTVHAFQGSEADVVIWDLVEAGTMPVGRLYHDEMGDRLTNVAISRAQGKLIVVGDPEVFFNIRGGEMVKATKNILFNAFVRGRNTLSAAEALAQLGLGAGSG